MDHAAPLVRAVLNRADDALILGHRLSEWTGRAPLLEEELAIANIALDLIGQARALYDWAGGLLGSDEDRLAYFRDPQDWRCTLLVQLPNGDFAHSILRQAIFTAALQPWWQAASRSADATLAGIAARALRETTYHARHAATWLERLGHGTAESHRRCAEALEILWPYRCELLEDRPEEADLIAAGEWPDPAGLREAAAEHLGAMLHQAGLSAPADKGRQSGGRDGRHSEHLGHLLAVMQHLPRSHPGAAW